MDERANASSEEIVRMGINRVLFLVRMSTRPFTRMARFSASSSILNTLSLALSSACLRLEIALYLFEFFLVDLTPGITLLEDIKGPEAASGGILLAL